MVVRSVGQELFFCIFYIISFITLSCVNYVDLFETNFDDFSALKSKLAYAQAIELKIINF